MQQQHLSSFEVGQVKAHVEHGLSAAKIADRMVKADGKSTFHENTIQNCINKLTEQPGWRGEREPGSGRPRKTTTKQDEQIVKWLLEERGFVCLFACSFCFFLCLFVCFFCLFVCL